MTIDDALVELAQLTTLSAQEWADFLTLNEADQLLAVDGYRACSWVQSPDTLKRVIEILQVVGMLAGVVAGVAGAAGAVNALRAL